ncbi:MAG: FecR domain-containing protein [Candidatus Competibacteraceae bacterium]|nr:MAG: FecR domain-containing protein [Candidatus Competibacteraceae bacterium]
MTKSHSTRHIQALMTSLAALLGLLLSVVAWAAPEAIGTLAEAQGRVEINGVPTPAGAELRLGMRVVTGTDSQATLKFLDGQTINLDPETVFWIKNYRYAKDKPKNNRSSTALVKGGMRFISGAMSKESPQAIRIDTPVATIGIRGTEFTMTVGSDGLYLHVISGAVMVTAAGQTVTATAGQVVTVDSAGNPPSVGAAPPILGSTATSTSAAVTTATIFTEKTAAIAAAVAAAVGTTIVVQQNNQDDQDASPQ